MRLGPIYNSRMVRIEMDSVSLREAANRGGPVEVVDPITGQAFVLVTAEQYQKLLATISDEVDPRVAYPLVDRVLADDDLHDPLLDSYQP